MLEISLRNRHSTFCTSSVKKQFNSFLHRTYYFRFQTDLMTKKHLVVVIVDIDSHSNPKLAHR